MDKDRRAPNHADSYTSDLSNIRTVDSSCYGQLTAFTYPEKDHAATAARRFDESELPRWAKRYPVLLKLEKDPAHTKNDPPETVFADNLLNSDDNAPVAQRRGTSYK
jgi:hypothetical protein